MMKNKKERKKCGEKIRETRKKRREEGKKVEGRTKIIHYRKYKELLRFPLNMPL